MQRVLKRLAVAVAVLTAAGCSMSKKEPQVAVGTQGTQKGVVGQYYYVNLFSPPIGGIVTSDVGGIRCGASGATVNNAVSPPQYVPAYYGSGATLSNQCGQTRFAWGQPVILTAAPQGGNAFLGWAGDCQGAGTCTLSAGSDKTVVAIFGASGSGHLNLLDPALHGPAYVSFRAKAAGALQCDTCHGATLDGRGIAPSCNACHAKAGFADWQNSCIFCHANPPAAPHAQDDACGSCHAGYSKTGPATGTVNAATHLNGLVDVAVTTCITCHGNPPAAPHEQRDDCGTCHIGYAKTGPTTGTVNVLTHRNGVVDVVVAGCTTCHGTAGVNPAPPADTLGRTATTLRSVGAHQAHLGTTLMTSIACTECHGAASASYTTNHKDGTVQVAFGTLANHGPTTTAWNGTSCATSYCHGGVATLTGGSATAPVWAQVDGSQKSCASCHGFPPPLPHQQRDDCATCHAGYSKTGPATGTVNAAVHINGTVDVAVPLTCTSCHGTEGVNPAPPRDTTGAIVASAIGVGAHQAHVAATLSAPIACPECHGAASGSYTTAHKNGTVEMAFGSLSGTATWNHGTASCAASYCHGGTSALKGGTVTTPVWNASLDGSQKSCTACHGNPPPAPHPQDDNCATCHPGYSKTGPATGTVVAANHVNGTVDVANLSCTSCHGNPPSTPHVMSADCGKCHTGYTNATINPDLHYNGHVDYVTLTCTTCHGDVARSADPVLAAAPPAALNGDTAATARGVGAHQAHLTDGLLAKAYACTDCHTVPSVPLHTSGTVELTWSSLAGGAAASFNPADASCTTYCHGNFLGGNAANAPRWTDAGTGAACGSCHGLPPAGHPAGACATCHGAGYSLTTVNPATHANGVVDRLTLTCTSCHGGASGNAAPPADLAGHTATTFRGVGAHQTHLATQLLAAPLACTDCHGAAVASYTVSHSGNGLQVEFSALANTGVVASWTGATCSNYCHGAGTTVKEGSNTAPTWTVVNGTQATCATCHGFPPSAPHAMRDDCGTCHDGYGTKSGATATVNRATHLNGRVDTVPMTCTSCHGDRNQTASPAAPLFAAPPVDAKGNTAVTARGVGAHAKHVLGGSSRPVACDVCHGSLAAYTTLHSDGATPIAISGLGAASGAAYNGDLTCSSTYCHGNFTGGLTAVSPVWNAGSTTCNSCHTSPPTLRHVNRTDCGTCHPGYTSSTTNPATHVNGTVDVDPSLTCTTCHNGYGMSSQATYHHAMGADSSYASPLYPANNSPGIAQASDRTCTMCHVGHGLFAAPGMAMRSSIAGAVTAASNDEALCRSCHDQDQVKDNGAAGHQKSDGTSKTAGWVMSTTIGSGWASGSGQGSHNYTVAGSFQAGSAAAGAFTVNCVKCHNSGAANLYQNGTRTFSNHDNVDRSLRSSLGAASPADANEEAFCYRCHSLTTDAIGGTVKSSSTLDWYNQQPLPASSAGLYVQMQKTGGKHNMAGYSGVHRPNPAEETLQYIAANKHVECSDCHDPHQARRGSASVWGTVTTVAATTLSDTTASWIPGQWVGYSVTVATTTGATAFVRGQITANTATSLTYQTLTPVPTGLVKYRIGVRSSAGVASAATTTTLTDSQSAVGGAKAWAANAWAGWNVNIVYGVGMGQSYLIASNTGTQLTIAGTWTTTPTTASRYTITKLPSTMDGATGVKVTAWGASYGAANTVSPAAGSTTPIPEATSQNQVCFKCHSSANANLATWNANWTDQVKEFNPNNQSYHPIVAPAVTTSGTGVGNTQLTAAQLTPSATTINAGGMYWVPGDMMTCSDCHGNDTVTAAAAQGPHASAVAFLLKGPNTSWPIRTGTTRWTYSSRTTGEGTAAGLFCLNCHSLTSSVHSSNHTSYGCTQCHIRVPHGGKVRRLLATFANTLTAQGTITTGTPAPYVDTGVTQVLRAATGGTSSANCNAGCSGGTSTRSGHQLTVSATNSW